MIGKMADAPTATEQQLKHLQKPLRESPEATQSLLRDSLETLKKLLDSLEDLKKLFKRL